MDCGFYPAVSVSEMKSVCGLNKRDYINHLNSGLSLTLENPKSHLGGEQ